MANPSTGGGGGRWFSGSPADGYGCDVCHTSQPGQTRFPLYVTGLAMAGFGPAQAREIVLSWPEFSARWSQLRPDPTQAPLPGAPAPSLGLVTELVAESGKASGTIEISTKTASAAELCEMTRPNLQPRLAVRLYQVRRGVEPLLLRPDANGILRCESRQLGQRCVMAMSSCGAKQLRFKWVAPAQSEGPVWFSAGFVASEALSGTPEGDSFDEVTFPMSDKATASGNYEATLKSTCAVALPGAHGPGDARSLGALLAGAAAWLRRRARRRDRVRRQRVQALALGMMCLAAVSCASEGEGSSVRNYPTAGLYTPGSTLGASDPTDVPLPGMGLGQRCVTPSAASAGDGDADGGASGGTGVLQVDYTTQTLQGRYAPKNCSAVWVETVAGEYVATLELTAGLRRPGLVYWQERGCTQELGPDAIASATLRDHLKPHKLEWSGVDFMGRPMPDGAYKLYIEVTETDKEPGELAIFDFVKGTVSSTQVPVAAGGPLLTLTIAWLKAGGFL